MKKRFVIFSLFFMVFLFTFVYSQTCEEACHRYQDNMFSYVDQINPECSDNAQCKYNLVDKGITIDSPSQGDPPEYAHCWCFDSGQGLDCSTCFPHGLHPNTCTPKTCEDLGWECGYATEPSCTRWLHCGDCPTGQTCTNHQCTTLCEPATCAQMGWDCGYGFETNCYQGLNCGSCPSGLSCVNHHCSTSCTPDCDGKACGYDGCSDSCGDCPGDEYCFDYQCVSGTRCMDFCNGIGTQIGVCSVTDFENYFHSNYRCSDNLCHWRIETYSGSLVQDCVDSDKDYCNCYSNYLNCGSDIGECAPRCNSPTIGCCQQYLDSCTNDEDCCNGRCFYGLCCDSGRCCNTNDDCDLNQYCSSNQCLPCPSNQCGAFAVDGSSNCNSNQFGRFLNHCSLVCENANDSQEACEICNSKNFINAVFEPHVLSIINDKINLGLLSSNVKRNACCDSPDDCAYYGVCYNLHDKFDVDNDGFQEACG